MSKPRRFVSAVLAMLLVPAAGSTQDHLVTSADVQARFAAVAAERTANLLLRADLGRIRAGAASLTDEELRDVAARAKALTVDPMAGANPILVVLAVIGAIVVLAFIISAMCIAQGQCE